MARSATMPVIVKQGIGLGDVLSNGLARAGIKPCSGCARRAAALNRFYTFSKPAD